LSYIIISIPILAGKYDTSDPSKISEIISKVRRLVDNEYTLLRDCI
jgi:hypothetical protein